MKPWFVTQRWSSIAWIVVLSISVVAQTVAPPTPGQRALARLSKSLGIPIVETDPGFPIPSPHGRITGIVAERAALEAYIPLFVEEFALYPSELIRRAKTTKIVLCRDLAFAGQRRSAIPDFESRTLFLDVCAGSEAESYQRKVIHHEFFHLLDERDDGKVYSDEGWAALNPKDFRYGTGGANAQHLADTGNLTTAYPGFLNHYSTTGVEEDKAEVFAIMMMDPDYLAGRVQSDPVLAAKQARMQELLAKFCPAMNASFWKRVRAKERVPAKAREPARN